MTIVIILITVVVTMMWSSLFNHMKHLTLFGTVTASIGSRLHIPLTLNILDPSRLPVITISSLKPHNAALTLSSTTLLSENLFVPHPWAFHFLIALSQFVCITSHNRRRSFLFVFFELFDSHFYCISIHVNNLSERYTNNGQGHVLRPSVWGATFSFAPQVSYLTWKQNLKQKPVPRFFFAMPCFVVLINLFCASGTTGAEWSTCALMSKSCSPMPTLRVLSLLCLIASSSKFSVACEISTHTHSFLKFILRLPCSLK